jgi:large subunit ribosomal protein L9
LIKMKVLLLKDVYKLGHAGDVKRVADGYGRNYLIPQGLAALATAGAIKQAENIRARANSQRAALNKEMSGVAQQVEGLVIGFGVRAGETGKLYGSITTQMIADEIMRKSGTQIDRRQIECQPIRVLGEHKCIVRLTVDLTPEVKVIAHREGDTPAALQPKAAEVEETEEQTPVVEAPVAEVEVEEEVVEEAETPAEEDAA